MGASGSLGFLEGGGSPKAWSRAQLIINSQYLSADKRKHCLPFDSTDREPRCLFGIPYQSWRRQAGTLSQMSLTTSLKILATHPSQLLALRLDQCLAHSQGSVSGC